ncbi:MAG: transposase [Planctomycetota bacterium]
MSRRLRDLRVIDSIDRRVMLANDHLCQSPGYDTACALIVDGRPLVLSQNSRDPNARKGRAVGGFGLGYKLHQISDSAGVVHAFTVLPLNTSEIAATHRMLAGLPHQPQGRLLLGDRLFDVNGLYDAAAAKGLQLICPRRFARNDQDIHLAHQRHSPHRIAGHQMRLADPTLMAPRRRIEGQFGTQGNTIGGLGPLPNHVRRLHRVKRWVSGKLLIDAAHRYHRTNNAKAA